MRRGIWTFLSALEWLLTIALQKRKKPAPKHTHRKRNWRDRLDFSMTSSSVTVSRPPLPAPPGDSRQQQAGLKCQALSGGV